MNRTLSNWIALITLLALILSLTGCSQPLTPEQKEAKQKEAVLYLLKRKYGEEFIGVSYEPSTLLHPYTMYYVYPKNGDQEKDVFTVTADTTKYGVVTSIADSYYGIWIKPQYEKVVRSLLDKEFKEYQLELEMVNNASRSSVLDKNTTLDQIYDKTRDEYLSMGLSQDGMVIFCPRIAVWVNESTLGNRDVNAATIRFAKMMAEKKLVCQIEVRVLADSQYVKLPSPDADWKVAYSTMILAQDLSVDEILILKH